MNETEILYRIETCIFKRTKDSSWEAGFLLNEGRLGILDKYGRIVLNCWNWKRRSALAIDVDKILETVEREG